LTREATPESAPLLAGVLALATQLNHGNNVGPINNVLYHVLGPAGLTPTSMAQSVTGSNRWRSGSHQAGTWSTWSAC
jgi:hypothetical protein